MEENMKAIVLKPIMWNTKGYVKASGYRSQSGFSRDYGYGHEEWNNNPKRIWRNYKIFHTEATDKLLEYSETGELGIITIAAHDGKQYAISIATNVFDNDEDEREIIADELNIYDDWEDIWQLDTVRPLFSNNRRRFLREWGNNYQWIRWKCPVEQYFHFESPVLLDPQNISGKERLTSMHGRFQAIYPEQAYEIIKNIVPKDHPICDWLLSSDFDDDIISNELKEFRKPKVIRTPKKKSGSNSPANRKYQYWVEGNRSVEPYHAKLQAKYVRFIKSQGLEYLEDSDYVDIQYQTKNRVVFAEIKPTDNVPTKYAIRMAIGQLLEYQYRLNQQAKLEIVLGSEPTPDEKKFVASLKMGLVYLSAETNEFIRLLTY